MRRAAILLVILGLTLGAQARPAAAQPHGLALGVTDPALSSPDIALREEWDARASSARADLVLLGVSWSAIAPRTRPADFDPIDPADPAYDWESLDNAVRSALAHGLQPLLNIEFAPRWAEGPTGRALP